MDGTAFLISEVHILQKISRIDVNNFVHRSRSSSLLSSRKGSTPDSNSHLHDTPGKSLRVFENRLLIQELGDDTLDGRNLRIFANRLLIQELGADILDGRNLRVFANKLLIRVLNVDTAMADTYVLNTITSETFFSISFGRLHTTKLLPCISTLIGILVMRTGCFHNT
jgi:hypothetical protein